MKVFIIILVFIVLVAALGNWGLLIYNEYTNFRYSKKFDRLCNILGKVCIVGIILILGLILCVEII